MVLSLLTTWVWTGSAFVVPSAMAKGCGARHDDVAGRGVGPVRHPAQRAGPRPIPTDYAWEMLNPTESSSVGATQADQIPMGRAGTIEELANLVIFLFSDACEYLTGETIAMDGGQRLAGPNAFAGLTALSDRDWAEVRERSKAASTASKAQRSV